MRHLPLLAVVLTALAVPAAAQEVIDGPQEYRNCLILAKTKPDQGWEEALAWQSLGGGEAARHCGAVALIGMGKYGEAATRLETLANESVRADSVRAEMLAQAAQAWVLLGNIPRADSALRGALTLSPGNPDILMDQAVLMAQIAHYNEAADILSKVLRAQPNRIEALTLRGSAFRFLDNIPGAVDDIETALKLDPDYSEALLERGILRRMKGDDAGAREDWLRAINLVPESAAADTARRNLEKMDVKQR
ncbi:MAG TPA: tetratricopeptide repeat protein [Magnetospirillum sp.]|jgi:tetratricopeptide (TPR) repeat protein|nr:tetratricopeptide repeat protein [Magnetospirillum sp.]